MALPGPLFCLPRPRPELNAGLDQYIPDGILGHGRRASACWPMRPAPLDPPPPFFPRVAAGKGRGADAVRERSVRRQAPKRSDTAASLAIRHARVWRRGCDGCAAECVWTRASKSGARIRISPEADSSRDTAFLLFTGCASPLLLFLVVILIGCSALSWPSGSLGLCVSECQFPSLCGRWSAEGTNGCGSNHIRPPHLKSFLILSH